MILTLILSFALFFLNKFLNVGGSIKIYWFFLIIASLNIIYGFVALFILDNLIIANKLLTLAPLALSYCIGVVYWRKRA